MFFSRRKRQDPARPEPPRPRPRGRAFSLWRNVFAVIGVAATVYLFVKYLLIPLLVAVNGHV